MYALGCERARDYDIPRTDVRERVALKHIYVALRIPGSARTLVGRDITTVNCLHSGTKCSIRSPARVDVNIVIGPVSAVYARASCKKSNKFAEPADQLAVKTHSDILIFTSRLVFHPPAR